VQNSVNPILYASPGCPYAILCFVSNASTYGFLTFITFTCLEELAFKVAVSVHRAQFCLWITAGFWVCKRWGMKKS